MWRPGSAAGKVRSDGVSDTDTRLRAHDLVSVGKAASAERAPNFCFANDEAAFGGAAEAGGHRGGEHVLVGGQDPGERRGMSNAAAATPSVCLRGGSKQVCPHGGRNKSRCRRTCSLRRPRTQGRGLGVADGPRVSRDTLRLLRSLRGSTACGLCSGRDRRSQRP